jgi:putative flippase GtrA
MMRVGASGALSQALDVVFLVTLVEVGGVHVTPAAFAAATTGAIANFAMCKLWAFRDRSPLHLRQVGYYTCVCLLTACLVAATIHVFAVGLGAPYLAAKAAAAILVFLCWSYPAQARFVFSAPATARLVPREPLDGPASGGQAISG